jgi:hypothetical protein
MNSKHVHKNSGINIISTLLVEWIANNLMKHELFYYKNVAQKIKLLIFTNKYAHWLNTEHAAWKGQIQYSCRVQAALQKTYTI